MTASLYWEGKQSMENWRTVDGCRGYEVSDEGRVRSLIHKQPRLLKPCPTRYGHMMVTLGVGEERRTASVHALVMKAFGPSQPAGTEICHNDGDPANNAISNLRWASHQENVMDTVAHGRHNHARKTHCPHGHAYDSANTYVTPTGGRMCRTCIRTRKALARRRHAA